MLTDRQSEAVVARGNVIVVAGAGTGKTSTLVERCLDMVRKGTSLDRVLMVTFTEAAATEMRHRLRVKLQEWAGKTPDAAGRDRYVEQLALVETARISTIHSFCLRLVQSHFHGLGIDPGVSVLDEHQCRVLANESLDRLMEECCSGALPLHEAVRSLIAAYAPDSDLMVRGLVLDMHRYTQSLPDATGWIQRQEVTFASDSPVQWEEWLVAGFTEWSRVWRPLLEGHSDVSNIQKCVAALDSLPENPPFAAIREALGAILQADQADWNKLKGKVRTPLARFFDDTAFLASVVDRDALKDDWHAVSPHMRALLALTREFTARFTRAKRELAGVDFPDLEQLTLQLLLDANGQPSTVAQEIQAQVDYVFVDECQDINGAQDAILSALARPGPRANRFLVGDVKQSIYQFRLADPRIFRRYEADWAEGNCSQRIPLTENFRSRPGILEFVNTLFGGLMRNGFGGVSYEPLESAGSSPMKKGDDGPCVELHLIHKKSNDGSASSGESGEDTVDLPAAEREARLVAMRLRELKDSGCTVWDQEEECERAVDWRDMAVLMRSPRPKMEAYAKEFHRADIPLAATRAGFLEAIEVSDLVSLLRLLDNPLQDIPLLAVLRSPLMGLSLDELATIRVDSKTRPFWHALRRFALGSGNGSGEEPTRPDLDPGDRENMAPQELGNVANGRIPACVPLRTRVSCFLGQFDRWRETARQVGPSMCLEQVITDTGYDVLLSANDRGPEQEANVRRLLDYARQFDPYQRQGLHRFLRLIEALEDAQDSLEPAPVPSRNAVRLMSIHRSKGLEFPVVVLAGLGSKFNLQELNSLILLDQKYGVAPKAMTQSGTVRYPTLPFWLAERRQRAQRLGEELRLLYVATTRARDRLLLTGAFARKSQGRWGSHPASSVPDHKLLFGQCPMDWLLAWLPTVTRESDWHDDDIGASELMTWQLWDPQDKRLQSPAETTGEGEKGAAVVSSASDEVDSVLTRLSWQYAHRAATAEAAKSSVSALRSRAVELVDEDAVTRFAWPTRLTTTRASKPRKLSAAQVGTLHHRFMQYVDIGDSLDVETLARQVANLVERGLFSRDEADVIELQKIAEFWSSDVGQSICRAADHVKRELPFTARFDTAEVRSVLGRTPDASLTGEFVVVQGVVDLAVILNTGIWLLDFKTDDVKDNQLGIRVEEYRPQLRLYALALERIYGKPVRQQWLHFFAARKTVSL